MGVRLYSKNVCYRTMLSPLGQTEGDSDAFVKSVFKEGKFVWAEDCAPNFTQKTFWYLYGTLKE
jgi:hypothetical protein